MEKGELIEELRLYEVPEDILSAFEKVPREEFVPPRLMSQAYENHPLPIGYGQTISQPIMIADMMKHLDLKEGQKVLEIGAGSGYQAALLKGVVGEEGKVISIERVPELVEFAKGNLERAGYDVEVVLGDGTLGYPEGAPYDRIIVTAGSPDIPQPLIGQLNAGGRLVVPVGGRWMQELLIIDKVGDGIKTTRSTPCVFVKLIGEYGWPE